MLKWTCKKIYKKCVKTSIRIGFQCDKKEVDTSENQTLRKCEREKWLIFKFWFF